jgi:predicted transcriptional regulator
MLAAVLTPKRLELMKTLRQSGPLSVRALAKQLVTPWDVIDAHVRLVA